MAAENGNVNAQFNLGLFYEHGKGVTKNISQAINWYRIAGEQGDALSLYNLGTLYYKGSGIEQNKHVAKELFGRSCDNQFQQGCDSYKNLNKEGY